MGGRILFEGNIRNSGLDMLRLPIRHWNGVVKFDRGVCGTGARPGDRNLRTLKYLEHDICPRSIS